MGSEIIKTGNYNMYYTMTFSNGVEVVSDTLVVGTLPTDVEEFESSTIPSGIQLLPCYPNPFNPSTTIAFTLSSKSFVTLKIFDLIGREVTTIISGEFEAGKYSRQWNAEGCASGVYYYRIQAGNLSTSSGQVFVETKKLVLLK
jgi:hypothetical protein